MEQPLDFVTQWEIVRVCRLRKSLSGLKQSPCAWFGKFNEVIEKFGIQIQSFCLLQKFSSKYHLVSCVC